MNHFSEKRGGNKADAQVNSGDNRNHKYMTFVFFVRGLAFRSDEDIYLQSQVSHTAETFDQNCRWKYVIGFLIQNHQMLNSLI